MNDTGNSSIRNDGNTEGKEHGHEPPSAVPPDLQGGQQKARERGHWWKEALIKGATSGAVRAAIEEALNNLI